MTKERGRSDSREPHNTPPYARRCAPGHARDLFTPVAWAVFLLSMLGRLIGELFDQAAAAGFRVAQLQFAPAGAPAARRSRASRPLHIHRSDHNKDDLLDFYPAPGSGAGSGAASRRSHGGIGGWRQRRRRRLYIPPGVAAAVIPAHNEEAVLGATLRSVLAIYHPEDVYIFCDNCNDSTADIARQFLPDSNVIVGQSQMGKSKGLEFMMHTYIYPREYVYVTIVDADTTLDRDFLNNSLKVLRYKDIACVVGQVKSRWHSRNLISVYRTYVYTLWQMIYKRLQSYTNAITIASGCSTTWKTRVLRQLDFDHRMSTEDFSLTIQVHRKRLGKIKYVSSATVWTQDPFTVSAYRKQMYRWDRAWWEAVRKYQVGVRWVRFKKGVPVGLSVLDVSTLLIVVDVILYMISLLALPILLIHPINIHFLTIRLDSRSAILHSLIWQYGGVLISALIVAIVARRPRVFLYSPVFLFLVYVDILVSLRAVLSTIRSQYRVIRTQGGTVATGVWVSPERRKEA